MKIAVLVSFLAVLGLFIFATQVPIGIITKENKVSEAFKDKVSEAVSEAISESEVLVDEDVVEHAVLLSLKKLDDKQRTRLKYLVSAYLVIWLVFILYILHLERRQQELDKRLAQLEQESESDTE